MCCHGNRRGELVSFSFSCRLNFFPITPAMRNKDFAAGEGCQPAALQVVGVGRRAGGQWSCPAPLLLEVSQSAETSTRSESCSWSSISWLCGRLVAWECSGQTSSTGRRERGREGERQQAVSLHLSLLERPQVMGSRPSSESREPVLGIPACCRVASGLRLQEFAIFKSLCHCPLSPFQTWPTQIPFIIL